MVRKKIEIKPKKDLSYKTISLDIEEKLDQWVSGNSPSSAPPAPSPQHSTSSPTIRDESTYRFTVVIPTYLHRRIKKNCAINGVKMGGAITEVLEKAFPEN